MVYAGFRDSRLDIPDPHPAQSAPDPHDEENMNAGPEQDSATGGDGASHQHIPAAVGEAREEGHPTVTVAQACSYGSARSMSVAEAMEAGFLQALDQDQADMFIVHPVRVAPVPTCSGHILGNPSLFGDIFGLSTRLFLSCRCSRIAPYAYQICTSFLAFKTVLSKMKILSCVNL